MSLLQTIDFLDKHEPLPFIAPILTKDTTKVLTIQNSIPYWFDVRIETPGWWTCEPQANRLIIDQEAYPWECIEYLNQLDRFYVIALFPIDETTWLVSPYNLGDAEQRGWKDGEPRAMYLVEGTLTPMEFVKARVLGNSLVYDSTAIYVLPVRRHGKSSAVKLAQSIVQQRIAELEKQEEEQRKAQEKKSQQDVLEDALKHTGATLIDWTRDIDGYKVTWEINGRQRTTKIDTKLRVLSAGVCLDNTDNWHSLTSIVSVMEDSWEERGY